VRVRKPKKKIRRKKKYWLVVCVQQSEAKTSLALSERPPDERKQRKLLTLGSLITHSSKDQSRINSLPTNNVSLLLCVEV
jgi:hypothetical protein